MHPLLWLAIIIFAVIGTTNALKKYVKINLCSLHLRRERLSGSRSIAGRPKHLVETAAHLSSSTAATLPRSFFKQFESIVTRRLGEISNWNAQADDLTTIVKSTKLSEKREFINILSNSMVDRSINRVPNSKAMLRILQFNVLADCLCESGHDSGDFSRADAEVLRWDYRKDRLLKEIVQYEPDIITLQEVDHYHDFFLPKLRRLGYFGFFAPKPTSKCLECGKPADGCAMFINTKRLRVLCSEIKTLASRKSDLSPKNSGLDEMQDEEFKIYTQNQVALIAACELMDENHEVITGESLLQSNKKGAAPPIIICTAHLKSAKTEKAEAFRLEGITNALNSVQRLFETYTAQGTMPAVILSGDFNAVPGKTYQRLSDGRIEQYSPWTYPFVKQHPLDFRSVYNDDVVDRLSCGKQLYTTWKARKRGNDGEIVVKRCIDYIFYAPFMQRTLETPMNLLEDVAAMKSISSNVVNDDSLPKPALVMNKTQIALSFIGRLFVYWVLFLVCTTAAVSTQHTLEDWRSVIIAGSFVGWLVFEASIEGTFFKPVISSKITRPMVPPVEAPTAFSSTNGTNGKKNKELTEAIDAKQLNAEKKRNSPQLSALEDIAKADWIQQLSNKINKLLKDLRYAESNLLRSVSEFSQRVSPLKQFGRPGFRCVAALDIFSEQAMKPNLIPSKDYPSDHVAIAADLELLW